MQYTEPKSTLNFDLSIIKKNPRSFTLTNMYSNSANVTDTQQFRVFIAQTITRHARSRVILTGVF